MSQAERARPLVIDLLVDRPTARGRGRKVFKWPTRTLRAGDTLAIDEALPIRQVSTRTWHPGPHRLALLVNGEALADAIVEVRA